MRRGFLSAVALLVIPCAVLAQGFDDSEGAVLAKPPDPRPQISLASMFSAPPQQPSEPVIHPAPANPLPPAAVHAPMPRVELPAYPPTDRPILDRKAYSLWTEKPAPLELPPERVGVLSADGRINDAVASKPGAAPEAVDQMFVNIELEIKEGGELRDAVAELSNGAGFRADMRFPATRSVGAPRSVSVWGWLPTTRLGAAAQLPSVRKLSSSAAARAEPGRAVSPMLIGLRVPDGFDPAVAVATARAELASEAGVVWRRTVGYQAVPGSRDLAMIGLVDVPVRSLSRVLAHPAVLRIAPAPVDNAIPDVDRHGAPPGSAPSSFLGRFRRHIFKESPVLLVLTVLLLLPPLTKAAKALSRLL